MSEAILVERARGGDQAAFEVLVSRHRPAARRAVRRLVGHPDETDELVQEALLKAWRSVARFRGEAGFGTWLVQIAVRTALDHLRQRKRWRTEAQPLYAQACREDERLYDPAFHYDVREHIAFCFTCVARTLEPEEQAAVVLRDVVGMTNSDAAKASGIASGAFRHRLASGRSTLTERFEGLCALVNKQGVCWQCEGLRQAAPADRQGAPAEPIEAPTAAARYTARAAIAQTAALDTGVSRALHDVFFRHIHDQEEAGRGELDEAAAADCRPDS